MRIRPDRLRDPPLRQCMQRIIPNIAHRVVRGIVGMHVIHQLIRRDTPKVDDRDLPAQRLPLLHDGRDGVVVRLRPDVLLRVGRMDDLRDEHDRVRARGVDLVDQVAEALWCFLVGLRGDAGRQVVGAAVNEHDVGLLGERGACNGGGLVDGVAWVASLLGRVSAVMLGTDLEVQGVSAGGGPF